MSIFRYGLRYNLLTGYKSGINYLKKEKGLAIEPKL
jgi:hypothetical protein